MSNDPDYSSYLALSSIVVRRFSASTKILHLALTQQNYTDALLALTDIVSGYETMLGIGTTLLESGYGDAIEDMNPQELHDHYSNLLMQATGGDTLVLLGDDYIEQVTQTKQHLE